MYNTAEGKIRKQLYLDLLLQTKFFNPEYAFFYIINSVINESVERQWYSLDGEAWLQW